MSDLRPSISVLRGTGLMLNIVIGAGLLALPGLAVDQAGDHALWAWLATAVIAIPLLVVFTLMGQRFPDAGGIAHFTRQAFGPLGYIMASVVFLGTVLFGMPAITLTGGYYLAELVPGNPNIYAMLIVLIATLAHVLSTEWAGRISTLFASSILIALCGLIFAGVSTIDWQGVPERIAPLDRLDINLVFAPFMMIFFAFTGWEVAAGISEEFKNPKRDFPKAMALSFIIASGLYFILAFIVQNTELQGNHAAAFILVAEQAFGAWGKNIMACLAVLIILANIIGLMWAISRQVFSLSREGYLPIRLTVNSRGSPVSSVIIVGLSPVFVLSFSALGLIDIDQMLSLAGQNFLILFGMAGLALFVLSQKRIDRLAASFTLLIVVSLLIVAGETLIYPAGLIVLAVLLWLAIHKFRLK